MRTGVGGSVLVLLILAGCNTVEHDTNVAHVEEYRVAPTGEARFDQPPELGYRRPEAKKEFKPGLGSNGPGGVGGPNPMGAGGMR